MGRRSSVLVAVAVVLTMGATCQPAQQPPPPPPPSSSVPWMLLPPPPDQAAPANSPDLTVDNAFVTGLGNPWDIAFPPGDAATMFFTERSGNVSLKLGANPRVILGIPPLSAPSGEGGVMGLAVDPNFATATSRFIYVCYSTASDNRVVQFTIPDPPTTNSMTAPVILVSGIPRAGSHNGCRVRFGPDGNLWVTTGDATSGPGPQSLTSLAGKVLRMTPAGASVPGNVSGLIYTYGHRNVQGLAIRPGTGQPYSTEHGPNINDEVNQLVASGNGGWDPNDNGAYDQSVPMTDLAKFPNAMIPAWRSGDTFTLAPSGATFLENIGGMDWGSWNGALAVAFLKDSCVRVMFLDANGNVSFATRILNSPPIRLRSAVQGPDGALYIATDVGTPNGAIWRVVPT